MGGELDVTGCQQMFADFGRQTAKSAPLYSRLAYGIAEDPTLARLLLHAPARQQLPVLLFACVHLLLIENPDEPLAQFYPSLSGPETIDDDPTPAFRRLCAERVDELAGLLGSRHTQTNEIGRTNLLLPCLGLIELEMGALAHIDIGASAGLNLLIPHYDFDYRPGGRIDAASSVRLSCDTRGRVPVPPRHPAVTAAIGIDRSPIDVADEAQARWLEACIWPEQVDRFERLGAAIALARRIGVDVRRGDAVADVAAAVEEASRSGHPVITSSWVMNYLTADERQMFVGELDRIGHDADLSFVYAESPPLCQGLPGIPAATNGDQPTAVVVVCWRGGQRTTAHVANAHPHGAWMHWR